MSKRTQGGKKALMFLTVPRRERRPNIEGSFESVVWFHHREAIKRKAVKLDADIVAEFAIPKPSNRVDDPLFREMLHVISEQQIDYVLIYPDQPHRIREESALITTAINNAGAHVVSVTDFESVPEALQGILSVVADFDRFERREAQLRRKWERQNRAADAA